MKRSLGDRFSRVATWAALTGAGLGSAAALLTLFEQNSCSLVLSTNANQCNTDQDCKNLGAQFLGYTCNAGEHVCVKANSFCTSNSECSAPTVFCNLASNSCVECGANSDCPQNKHFCDVKKNICFQCGTNADCSAPNPFCNTATNTCTQCGTNADCTAPNPFCNTATNTCTQCGTNADCNPDPKHPTAICNKTTNACVDVLKGDCNQIVSGGSTGNSSVDLLNDNVVLVGASMPSTGAVARNGIASLHGLQIMSAELKQVLGNGIPDASGTTVPVNFVVCDEGGVDPVANMNHLIDDLHVPAIVGPQSSAPAIPMTTQALFPKKVLSIAHTVTTSLLINPPGKVPFMWRMNASDEDVAKTMALLVPDVYEPTVKNMGLVNAPTTPLKVMVFKEADAQSAAIVPFIQQYISFNGKSGDDNLKDGNLVIQDAGDIGDQSTYKTRLTAAVQAAVAFKPHVTIVAGQANGIDVLNALEAAWTLPDYKPRWVLSSSIVAANFASIVGVNNDLRIRIAGGRFGPKANEPRNAALLVKYNALFAQDTTTQFGGQVALAYDASWLLTLAMIATTSDNQPLTGENISAHVHRLIGGATQVLPDNPQDIANATSVIRKGGSISWVGASSPCNFNQFQDTEPSIFAWCVGALGSPNLPSNRVVGAGLDLDKDAGVLTGNFSCFPLDGGGGGIADAAGGG